VSQAGPASWWNAHAPLSIDYLESNFPCRAACPVGTNAGGYVSLVANGHDEEAYALARGPNPFASVCGRICAHPCEAACRRQYLDSPLQIRALKRFVNERCGIEAARDFESIAKIVERPRPKAERPGNIAIVGAGPSGLACAHDLALMGHKVIVYDAAPVAGGMMRLGIPEYRLPRKLLDREIDFVRWLGVEIRLGFEIGRDASFAGLSRDHDALYLAPGCRRGRPIKMTGVELEGVLTAVDFLANVNLGVAIEIGGRVVVIGGGNVAYDVARSARRFGGTSEPDEEHHSLARDAAVTAARLLHRQVTMLALESRAEMPADAREIEEGAEEGVTLVNRRGTKEILGANGRVRGLVTLDVARVFDEQGRFSPEMIPGTEREIACDTVIIAAGQMADLSFLGEDHGLKISPRNLVEVDPKTLATSRRGVFAGGDIAFGPRIVIAAVADGRRAARSIDTFLTGREDQPIPHRVRVFETFGYDHPFARGDYEKIPRHALPVVPVIARGKETEVERLLAEEDARVEGRRCLHCWVNTIFDASSINATQCIECGGCADVCPEQCIELISIRRTGKNERGAALIKDESACIRCGLCARRCPVGLITMQALYREDEEPLVRLAEASL
jgi:formate dehydrogenase (NADP+) beta subunit